ncbi:ABC transporter permease [Acidobacteriota bacterium]
MFKNYLKTAYRNIFRHKGISTINIAGMALGIACSLTILLWVDMEFHFDTFVEKQDRIYRIEAEDGVNLPTKFRQEVLTLPEVEQLVQFNSWETPTLRYQDKLFNAEHFVFADKNVFEVFSMPLLQGNPKTALENPLSLVLTESEAKKIFGEENPIGKTIRYDNAFDFTVTGVLKDTDFHVKFNALAPFESLPEIKGRKNFLAESNWNFPTYLLLNENANIPLLEEKIHEVLNVIDKGLEENIFILRPFREIYFASGLKNEKGVQHGNRQMLVLFSAIGIFILLIACINFINLSTARSSLRAKEIGVRKVVGADQRNLFSQFMGETLLITFISLMAALVLIKLFLPALSWLTGKSIMLDFSDPRLIMGIILIFLFAGLAAGIFPAIFLSSFSPISVLRGKNLRNLKDSPLRKVLIVFQFSVSIFLIIGTLTVFRQLHYMKTMDLGFEQDQIINIHLKGELLSTKKNLFKDRLLQNPNVLQVSFSSQEPGVITNTNTWDVKGQDKAMRVINTDPEYLNIMGMELIAGRNISWEMPSDKSKKYVINEEAVRFLGFESPVGEIVRANFGNSEIIGVVKDYHFNSLHKKIEPLAICWYERWADIAHIKISSQNIDKIVGSVQTLWSEMCPDFPFQYSFLDEDFARDYAQENRLGKILSYFVGLAIFLSCLGLLGLSAFLAEQKTKEIGIRKILGSSGMGIMVLFSKDFSRWVLFSNLFAWPLAYLISNQWLQNFPYRTNINIWTFLISAVLALIIALFTVSYQSIKAAWANPADALRCE